MRIDSALSTSAKFGTRAQPSLFFPLGFQPSRAVANGAVTIPLPGPPGLDRPLPAGLTPRRADAVTVASAAGPGRELPATGTYRGPGNAVVHGTSADPGRTVPRDGEEEPVQTDPAELSVP